MSRTPPYAAQRAAQRRSLGWCASLGGARASITAREARRQRIAAFLNRTTEPAATDHRPGCATSGAGTPACPNSSQGHR